MELAKPNCTRSILSQPDMLIVDLRSPASVPAGHREPIAVVTPENLLLASKLLPLTSLYLIDSMMELCEGAVCVSRISPCLTFRDRWYVAIYKLAPSHGGASLEDIRERMHEALATAIAPSSNVDGLVPKTLAKIACPGRLSLLEFIMLLKAQPRLIDNLKLVGSMLVEIKFLEADGETYSRDLLVAFIGGWLFSAVGSDSLAAGKRRLHDPPGTHGYTALVPMTGRRPFERLRYDVDTGRYVLHTAAARYTASVCASVHSNAQGSHTHIRTHAPSEHTHKHIGTLLLIRVRHRVDSQGSYVGGGAFPYPPSLGSPPPGSQWTYSLVDEKHVSIPMVNAGELPRAPNDTPLALQEKVARTSKPVLSRFLFGYGRLYSDDRESRRARLSAAPVVGPGSMGGGGNANSQEGGEPAPAAEEGEEDEYVEPEEELATDPTVGAEAVAGDRLRARDSHGKWYAARVEAVRGGGDARELRVHFMGWHKKWDEWVPVGAGRLKSAV